MEGMQCWRDRWHVTRHSDTPEWSQRFSRRPLSWSVQFVLFVLLVLLVLFVLLVLLVLRCKLQYVLHVTYEVHYVQCGIVRCDALGARYGIERVQLCSAQDVHPSIHTVYIQTYLQTDRHTILYHRSPPPPGSSLRTAAAPILAFPPSSKPTSRFPLRSTRALPLTALAACVLACLAFSLLLTDTALDLHLPFAPLFITPSPSPPSPPPPSSLLAQSSGYKRNHSPYTPIPHLTHAPFPTILPLPPPLAGRSTFCRPHRPLHCHSSTFLLDPAKAVPSAAAATTTATTITTTTLYLYHSLS